MGLQIKLTEAVTDQTIPKLYNHPLLNEGSLLLVDPTHPDGEISALTTGTVIPNIAWERAKVWIPSGNQTTLSPVLTTGLGAVSNRGKLELTTKKGLHGIVSQVNDIEIGNDAVINESQLIREYIFNNVANGIYTALIQYKTRLALTGNSVDAIQNSLDKTKYITLFEATATQGGDLGFKNLNPLNQLGFNFRDAATSAKTSTPLITDVSLYKFGSLGNSPYASSEVNKAPSQILYIWYIEDLNKSGYTYAQTSARVQNYYTMQSGLGGSWYADTFTDPTTIP